MKINKVLSFTLSVASIYFVLGNMDGYGISKGSVEVDGILYYLFLPYTLTWGLATMVGFDWFALTFIVLALLLSMMLFFPIGLYLVDRNEEQ